jgi:hypothetical protein
MSVKMVEPSATAPIRCAWPVWPMTAVSIAPVSGAETLAIAMGTAMARTVLLVRRSGAALRA